MLCPQAQEAIYFQRSTPPGSTSIRYQSDGEASDRCIIDIDPMVFATGVKGTPYIYIYIYIIKETLTYNPIEYGCKVHICIPLIKGQ